MESTINRYGAFGTTSLAAMIAVALAFAALCLSASPLLAQTAGHRLILKDGSYQSIIKYEIHGDRVRYFSAERGEWEEVPKELVDWDATKKYEEGLLSVAPPPEAVELDKELAAERKAAEVAPEAAPGLRVPGENGVYLLDSYQGEPQIDAIEQFGTDLNSGKKPNILRSAINPLAGSKQTVELPQAHAKVQSHTAVPSLYLNLEAVATAPATAQAPGAAKPLMPSERFRIIRLDVKVDKRIAGSVKTSITGNSKTDERFIPATVVSLPGGWFKITPLDPLPDGEYAAAEMLSKDTMNLDVWDFGVSPTAAANPSAMKPEPSETKPAASQPEELKKKEQQ